MKRSILLAMLTVVFAVNASAQRKVLVEEFTSSTCPPCAATDPIMEDFEVASHDDIVVLKYHQNYPNPGGDIMYRDYQEGALRAQYYGVTGIPWVQFNGITEKNPGYGIDTLQSITNRVMNRSNAYYTLTVTQQITADSIIAFVTVKSGAQIDANATINVAVAEANVLHQLTTSRFYHTSAVRTVIPDIQESGAPGGPVLTLAPNSETTYRFAAKLGSTWNKELLHLVAFVQNPETKEVLGVETNKPAISIEPVSSTAITGTSGERGEWIIKNIGGSPLQIKLLTQLTKTTPYTLALQNQDGSAIPASISLAPGAETRVFVRATSSGANSDIQKYALSVTTNDNIGATGAGGLVWGSDNKNVWVDAGVGSYTETYQGATRYSQAIGQAGMTVAVVTDDDLREFANWNMLDNIFWAAGYAVGLYTDNGDTNKVRQFIANGGNFVMSSMQFAGVYDQAGLGSYPESIFGVYSNSLANGAWSDLIGVSGDPVGNGLGTTETPYVVQNIVVTNSLEPATLTNPTAAAAFKNENDETVAVHAEHQGGGKTLLMTFEPGNITSATQRRAVVKAIVDWLNGTQGAVSPVTEKNGVVLKQNFPNPFNPGTTMSFELPQSGYVTLKIQDMMGREVATVLDNEFRGAGENTARFDASELASGNYMYVLSVDGQRLERMMTLAK